MSTLFTIKDSIHDCVWLFEALAFASPQDAIVLTQAAVTPLHSPTALASFAAKCSRSNISLYVLSEDMHERGINNKLDAVTAITRAELLNLVLKYDKQVAW